MAESRHRLRAMESTRSFGSVEGTLHKTRADDHQRSESFPGAWTLVSCYHVLPSGEVSKPYGDSPSGLILYQACGSLSAQLSIAAPAGFEHDDPLLATADEAAAAWRNYFGYWGSFRVYSDRQIVVHRVEGSSFSNWIGTEQVRHFRVAGTNRLFLETDSAAGRCTLLWEKSAQ